MTRGTQNKLVPLPSVGSGCPQPGTIVPTACAPWYPPCKEWTANISCNSYTNLKERCHYSCFTDEESRVERLNNLPEVTETTSDGRSPNLQGNCWNPRTAHTQKASIGISHGIFQKHTPCFYDTSLGSYEACSYSPISEGPTRDQDQNLCCGVIGHHTGITVTEHRGQAQNVKVLHTRYHMWHLPNSARVTRKDWLFSPIKVWAPGTKEASTSWQWR